MGNKVIVYTQDVCKYCNIVKNYLDDKGVDYEVRNINEKISYMKELEDLGYQTVPVTVINDEPVVGFNLGKLNQLLGQ